jgi:ketosteroid isomerase-like protein
MAQTEITYSSKNGVKTAERDREIGEILNRFSQFVQAKDLAGLLELFSDEVVVFDLQTPFQYVGSRALMSRLSDWFKSYDRGISYDFDQLRVHSTDSLAVAHALVKCSGVLSGDTRRDEMWMRVTFTFMKTEGDWLIVHQHSSEPFDMETGRVISQRDEGEDEVPPSPSKVAGH